jgi:hypothetical protein
VEARRVRRPSLGLAAAIAVIVALVVGAAVLAFALTGGEAPEGDVRTFEARASLAPARHLFGDPVTAEIVVAFNRLAIDPGSIRVRARFRPYLVVGRSRVVATEGRSTVVRHRFRLLCMDGPCLGATRTRRFALPAPEVDFTPTDGRPRTSTLAWPPLEQTSRLRDEHLEAPTLTRDFRIRLAPPEPQFTRDAGAVAAVLYAGALLLLALALWVLRPELRRMLALLPRRSRDPLAGLPPLERALVLVERAGANGRNPHELRAALDRLAQELRRTGAHELAISAKQLAWSPPAPDDPELGSLTGDVRRLIGVAA